MTTTRLIVLALAAISAVPALAQGTAVPAPVPKRAVPAPAQTAPAPERTDRAEIDRTQIIGNRELPKVLYIVPWKKPLPGAMSGRPAASVLDEALAPVDRDVFRRQVQYDAQLGAAPTDPSKSAAPATPAR